MFTNIDLQGYDNPLYDAALALYEKKVKECFSEVIVPTLDKIADIYTDQKPYFSHRVPQGEHLEVLDKTWWEGDLVIGKENFIHEFKIELTDKVWFRFTAPLPLKMAETCQVIFKAYAYFENQHAQQIEETWALEQTSENRIIAFVKRALTLNEEAKAIDN